MTFDLTKQKSLRILALAFIFCILISPSFANRKTTNFMSDALKNKASGNINKAISNLNKAISVSTNNSQTILALFMLGDCQVENKKYSSARRTYKRIIKETNNPEDLAEAKFGLAQTEYKLGNVTRSNRLCREIGRKHKKSPYAELARAFVKIQKYEHPTQITKSKKRTSKPQVVKVAKERKTTKIARIANVTQSASVRKNVTNGIKKKEKVKTQIAVKAIKKKYPKTNTTIIKNISNKTKFAVLDSTTQLILQDLLFIPQASKGQKARLASQIISDQNNLKNGGSNSDMSRILFRLATATAFFGEHMQACKFYDELLTKHPTSIQVEEAYFEAIRLRAILKVFGSVKSWSKAFLAAFPTSNYRKQIRALVRYSNLNGKVNLNKSIARKKSTKKSKTNKTQPNISAIRMKQLKSEVRYKEAMRKMKDDNYQLALKDFLVLAKQYPNMPDVWWNITLIYVQLEKLSKADKTIKKMLELDPGNKDAHSLLGYINYRLKKFDNAAKAYKKAADNKGSGVTFFDADKAAERMQNR